MKPVGFPLYLQTEAIAHMYGQLFDLPESSRKSARTHGKSSTTGAKAKLAVTLLQVLGVSSTIKQDQTELSDYSEEYTYEYDDETRLRAMRSRLREKGLLYNLNACLQKRRPFGPFVDFVANAKFSVLPPDLGFRYTSEQESMIEQHPESAQWFRNSAHWSQAEFVQVTGTVEHLAFTAVCSRRFFDSSWLFGRLSSKTADRLEGVDGFGIVMDCNLVRGTLGIKPLAMHSQPQAFGLHNWKVE
jgi:hypothetical protein